MSENAFIPQMKHKAESDTATLKTQPNDRAGAVLLQIAQYCVVALFGLLPLVFVPGLWASLSFDKTLFSYVLLVVAVVMVSLLALRQQQIKTVLPLTLGIFWTFILVAFAAGQLSGDTQDAFRGSIVGVHTIWFLFLLAIAMTVPLILQRSKIFGIKALLLFSFSAALLLLYNLLRLVFGADFLPLGSFHTVTVSPLGGFNDLAIFSGLVIILSLITLARLPLRPVLQYLFVGLIVMALAMLSVVNFFNVWIVVGFFSLLLLLFILSRDTLFKTKEAKPLKNSRSLILAAALAAVCSVVFLVGGDQLSAWLGQKTHVDYIEVRPSISATIDIAQGVYKNGGALLGVGPNHFADAWRLYKDPSINSTIFWDTDFTAGNGYIPTLFVTTGLLGGALIVLFQLGFLYLGYRMFIRSTKYDPYWYFFGLVSFVSACFIWGLSYAYVPGSTMLLLGALFTGFTFAAAGTLLPERVRTIPLLTNRRRGFVVMAVIVLVLTFSVGLLFTISKQYTAEASFAKARATTKSLDAFDAAVAAAYEKYPDERFTSARVQSYLGEINRLMAVQQPTEEQQRTFSDLVKRSLVLAEQAVNADPANPDYYMLLAGVYSDLAMVDISDDYTKEARARAESALEMAETLDPLNPGYHLIAAQLAARIGDKAQARAELDQALELKRNFTQALYFSAQLDISEGKTESAIATTRSIITLEPKNPTRYFQLGVLLAATDQLPEAIAAYRAAVSLDPQYANARYLLAIAYLNSGQTAAGLEQLRVVEKTNADNAQLQELIAQVEAGEYKPQTASTITPPVNDPAPEEESAGTITTEGGTETDLVTPVNTPAGSEEGATEVLLPDLETLPFDESSTTPLE